MKAKWHGTPYLDHGIRKWLITLELEKAPEIYDKTKDADLSVEIKKWYDKRSLPANSYFHVLVDKIAEATKTTHTEIHNQLIADYGCRDLEIPEVIFRDNINWLRIAYMHVRPTTQTRILDNGQLYRVYQVMRGSHTYNTAEMARLIDGAVTEAKALGIETLPPNELERMKAAWERKA